MAHDRNDVTITGYLTENAIFKTTPSGRSVTELKVAVNRDEEEHATYVSVDCWDTIGELCSDWQKGQRVVICGRLKGILRKRPGGRYQSLILVAEWVNEIN